MKKKKIKEKPLCVQYQHIHGVTLMPVENTSVTKPEVYGEQVIV